MPAVTKKDNPDAFKHWFNEALVTRISESLKKAYPTFNNKNFMKVAPKLAPLEMKPRVHFIRDAMAAELPQDYLKALSVLLKSVELGQLKGFELWPYTEFIQQQGLDHVEQSLEALYQLTSKFTAEFAVRPFLIKHPKKTFATLKKWSTDKDEHIRRWTSEGSRPRLPWGAKLHASIVDPSAGLEILEKLKFDDSLYVRKSVANHLNDIAKDHPDLVISTLKSWQKKVTAKDKAKLIWIEKQALRTLIKQGYKPALEVLGFGEKAQVKLGELKLNKKKFTEKDILTFELEFTSKSTKAQRLAVDYIIHYQKAGNKLSPKVFKLKVLDLKPNEKFIIKKNHSLKAVTTRRHYPGLHKLEIQINGKVLASADWQLAL
ncbi:DNA alkylation repair protein [Bdellovibrio sp. qaytius]|nr:DNA alkylation repair protein [Bdellovibrio sp. qaytius]